MRNLKKRKMVKIGQMKESLTKHPRHGAFISEDLICKIMLMLPARSLGKFRCVSKSWLSITTSPSFITAHLQHKRFTHQTLMIEASHCRKLHSKHKRFTHQTLMILAPDYMKYHTKPRLILPAFDKINARINLRKLPRLKILICSDLLYSCDGLIVAWIPMKNLHYVINPLTGHFCILPQSRFVTSIIGFYFHRPTSEYRLLADWDTEITYVLAIGKTKWRRIRDRLPAIIYECNSVEVNEILYWLAWKNRQDDAISLDKPPNILMTFDKETEIYNLLPLPSSEEFNDRGGGSLINFNGELGLWLISDNGIIDFWIMKGCWIKRYSIYHPDLKCSRTLSYDWNEGFAVSIKDEELFIGVIRHVLRYFLVHWNLKTGACFVQNLDDYSTRLYIRFPYIEALTFFDYSFKSLLSGSRS